MAVARLIASRVAAAALLLLVVSMLLFAATEVLPGDPATTILGQNATPERVAALREELGLDRPAPARYLDWIGGAVTGDLGTSPVTRRPVTDAIGSRLPNTLVVTGLAGAAIVVFSLALGIAAGTRPGGRRDAALSTASLLLVSVPEFVVAGVLVTVFASALRLLPPVSLVPAGVTPLDRPAILVLPVASLALVAGGWAARLVRAAVVDAGASPNVEAARLAGLPERQVLVRHLLPAALPPVVQAYALLSAFLVGGSVVVERVFGYPGLGQLLVDAVRTRDAPVVEGIGLLLTTAVVTAFLAADLVVILTNPRLRR